MLCLPWATVVIPRTSHKASKSSLLTNPWRMGSSWWKRSSMYCSKFAESCTLAGLSRMFGGGRLQCRWRKCRLMAEWRRWPGS